MKNILVSYLGHSGGTNLYSYEMTKGLIQNGENIYAVISEENTMLNRWKELSLKKLIIIPSYKSKISCLKSILTFCLIQRKKIKILFSDIKIDCVYIPALHILDRFILSIFKNSRIIITDHDPIAHSSYSIIPKLMWYWNKFYLKKADNIIILSETFRNIVIKKYNKNYNQIVVIPHGIFDYYNQICLKKRIVEYSKEYNFLFFGRIDKYKGLHVLSEAYKKICNKYNNVSLTIVGSGNFKEYENEYRSLKNIKIINRWIEDEEVNCFFKGKNIITVLPYIDATQSGIINIAMLNKSLVISTNVGGIKEQLKNNHTGILVEPNNVKALFEAMEASINNKVYKKIYIENAYREVKQLSWKTLSKNIVNILE